MAKKQSNLKEEKMNWWYSRWVALEEMHYQIIVRVLEDHLKNNPNDEDAKRTLQKMKINQEEHYTSRDEYYKRREETLKTK